MKKAARRYVLVFHECSEEVSWLTDALLGPPAITVQVSFTDKPGPPAANGSNASDAPAEETLDEPAAQESEAQ